MSKIENVYAIVFTGRKQMIGDRVLWSELYVYDEDDLKAEVARYKDRADYQVHVFRKVSNEGTGQDEAEGA